MNCAGSMLILALCGLFFLASSAKYENVNDKLALLKRRNIYRNFYRFGQAVPVMRGPVHIGQLPKHRSSDIRMPSSLRLDKRPGEYDSPALDYQLGRQWFGWRR